MMDNKEKELYLTCNCQGEAIKLNKFPDEDEYYLTVLRYKAESFTFWRRIKMAWKAFKGEGIETAGIELSSENWEKLKKF